VSDRPIHPEVAGPPPQAPSIGRTVLYRPTAEDRVNRGGAEFYPAVITRVWSPICVNLQVLADAGTPFFVTSVTFDPLSDQVRTWRWPTRV
jgi:hypothetical protein